MSASNLPTLSQDPAQLAADLDRFGYCLAEKLLSSDQVKEAERGLRLAAATRRQEQTPVEWSERDGDQWVLLLPVEDGMDHLIQNPLVLGLARHLFGARIHLSGFAAHVVHPGNQVMELHTDQWWLPQPAAPGEAAVKLGDIDRSQQIFGSPEPAKGPIQPAVAINVMWALSDFSAQSGGTRLVPGSHHSGRHPKEGERYEVVNAEVPAGGAVIWDTRTWHASGKNSSAAPRIGITTIYCAPQFRQMQNFALALKPKTVASLDEEMKSLLGFKLFSSYGATDDFTATFARPGYLRAD